MVPSAPHSWSGAVTTTFEPVSVRAVSVSQETGFRGQRQARRKQPLTELRLCETGTTTTKPANWGLFRTPGNLRLRETAWWAREDSNLQPDRYERSALTIELRARRSASCPRCEGEDASARATRPRHLAGTRQGIQRRSLAGKFGRPANWPAEEAGQARNGERRFVHPALCSPHLPCVRREVRFSLPRCGESLGRLWLPAADRSRKVRPRSLVQARPAGFGTGYSMLPGLRFVFGALTPLP